MDALTARFTIALPILLEVAALDDVETIIWRGQPACYT